jgi:opacity protein-like surface antigen
MKKLLFSLLAACLFAFPSAARASTNPYISISGGPGFLTNSSVDGMADYVKYKTGFLMNGAIGLKSDFARIEAEIGYHQNNVDKYSVFTITDGTNISIWSFMANGYLDFNMKDTGVSPYVMAGLGLANTSWNVPGDSFHDSGFAWQVGAGIGIKATDKVTIDLGYRYFNAGDSKFSFRTYSVASHDILAGLRYNF